MADTITCLQYNTVFAQEMFIAMIAQETLAQTTVCHSLARLASDHYAAHIEAEKKNGQRMCGQGFRGGFS